MVNREAYRRRLEQGDQDNLQRYEKELSKPTYNPLSREIELDLGRRFKEKGDKEALNQLITHNLRYVKNFVKIYEGQELTPMELISAGNLGIAQKAEKFDYTQGNKFITFIKPHIKNAIRDAFVESSRTIGIPYNKLEGRSIVAKARNKLIKELGREPTLTEITSSTKYDINKVTQILALLNYSVSLDSPVGENEENSTFHELIVDPSTEEIE